MRAIDADELKTAFPCGETVRTECVRATIDHMPTIEPERKGKWKRTVLGSTSGYGTTVMYQCSKCEQMSISKYHYCPNCGAKMEVEEWTREEAKRVMIDIRRGIISGTYTDQALGVAIEALVEPEVPIAIKEGQWIRKPRVYGVVYCSNCGYELRIPNSNYCPNCGHKMALETVEMRDEE